MADQVTIYNLALDRIGTSTTIQAVDENSAEASACNRYWAASIDETLGAHDWRFATACVQLALSGSAPPMWLYQYAQPANCVKVRSIVNPISYVSSVALPTAYPWAVPQLPPGQGLPAVPFELASGTDGAGNDQVLIWTSLANAYCLFTRRITATGLWDVGFNSAIVWRLAYNIALTITGKPDIQGAMLAGYNDAMQVARNQTANQGVMMDSHMPDWIQIRNGYWAGGDGQPLLTDLSV